MSAVDYPTFAARVAAREILLDGWVDGEPRLSPTPRVLEEAEADALVAAAERLGALWNEFTALALDSSDDALAAGLGLTPVQIAMARAEGPLWHGIARVDLFSTAKGAFGELLTTEINADTPTGEAEAQELSAIAAEDAADPRLVDPNRALVARFVATAKRLAARAGTLAEGAAVGLIYPTEFTEDLPLIRLYRRAFEAAGHPVVLGSPFNLDGDEDGGLRLFDTPIGLAIRHYKTDWWGERASAFDDEPLEDTEPLLRELGLAFRALDAGKITFVNPFSAILPQNKRSMAWMWERLHTFSRAAQETIRAHVPPTFRLEACAAKELVADRGAWVLKSDFGAEGEEVVLGRDVSAELFAETIAHARPGRWIAQQAFQPTAEPDGLTTNYGVYLVGGRASGFYLRRQAAATDDRALSTGVLVRLAG